MSRTSISRHVHLFAAILASAPSGALAAPPTPADAAPRLSAAARAILAGAKEEARRRTRYDLTMGYHVTTWRDGKDTKRAVRAGGDVDPSMGVCTDLVIRALRNAGYDLQALVSADRRGEPASYPQGKIDTNIDHRRVPNLLVYLRRHGQTLTTEATPRTYAQWQPGDIVAWWLKGRGRVDHIGIISDRRDPRTGRPWVIHAYPAPGYTAELDVLTTWRIAAHHRFPRDGKVRPR
jgi:hypothetical protein